MRPAAYQLSIVTAARAMLEDARDAARDVVQGSADWDFYYGVQTAAKEVLHAEVRASLGESDGWLGAETPSFRDGYCKARTALVMAGTALDPPLRVPVPRP
jgi:hypothetical protein